MKLKKWLIYKYILEPVPSEQGISILWSFSERVMMLIVV